jgi:large repetitive protein
LGTVVDVIGTGFTGISAASLDGIPAVYTFVSDTSVMLTVPSGAATGTIHIKNAMALASSSASFTVTKLAITGFTPASGPIGTKVMVTGSGFTGVTAVSIDGFPASFAFVNDGAITFTVPTGAATGAIHVKTPNGLAASPTNFVVP